MLGREESKNVALILNTVLGNQNERLEDGKRSKDGRAICKAIAAACYLRCRHSELLAWLSSWKVTQAEVLVQCMSFKHNVTGYQFKEAIILREEHQRGNAMQTWTESREVVEVCRDDSRVYELDIKINQCP